MPISVMPNELIFDTHPAGAQQACLQALPSAPIASATRLLQAWATECGPLNRVVTLWQGEIGDDASERERALDWMEGQRVSRLLSPRREVVASLLASPLLELRMYATHRGRCEDFVQALLAALPFRERYSPCAGLWTTRERGTDVAVHLWAYDSLETRMQARARAAADADWSRYRASIRPLLQHMQAVLLTPLVVPAGAAIA